MQWRPAHQKPLHPPKEPPPKNQNVSAHKHTHVCEHGPLVPHKHETRQRPDKTEHHELWKQCILQESHITPKRGVLSCVSQSKPRAISRTRMEHKKGSPAHGLLYQGSRCQRRNTFKSSQENRICFPELSYPQVDILIHIPSIPSRSSLCFQGKQADLTGTHLASVNRPRVETSGLAHHAKQEAKAPPVMLQAYLAHTTVSSLPVSPDTSVKLW